MAELTQEELDALAQKEADELLAQHHTKVTVTPEEPAILEREKQTLLSRVGLNSDPLDGAPKARRLASRDQGGPEAPPPSETQTPAPPVHRFAPAPFVPMPAEALAPRGDVDLEKVDPIQLAELAETAKAYRKTYQSLQAATDEARAAWEAAQARFMAYLQQ